MLTIAVSCSCKRITGTFPSKSKPMEPTKHQYDVDIETAIGFLKAHNSTRDFKVITGINHATLAGHTSNTNWLLLYDNGMLGSNRENGDYQRTDGIHADQFLIDNYELIQAMMQIIRGGGLGNGGTNFDAKTRRNSTGSGRYLYRLTLQVWMLWPVHC